MESCLKDEQAARDRIGEQWTQFAQSDKTNCARLATMGGDPSYVELLTCLEMARDVKNLPDHQESSGKNSISGQGG
jgi:hypothetical protein